MDADERFNVDRRRLRRRDGAAHRGSARPAVERDRERARRSIRKAASRKAIASRDTLSGVTLAWPSDITGEPVTIELSGLPIFDRDRQFLGYRGFGVCRDVARTPRDDQARGDELAAKYTSAAPKRHRRSFSAGGARTASAAHRRAGVEERRAVPRSASPRSAPRSRRSSIRPSVRSPRHCATARRRSHLNPRRRDRCAEPAPPRAGAARA